MGNSAGSDRYESTNLQKSWQKLLVDGVIRTSAVGALIALAACAKSGGGGSPQDTRVISLDYSMCKIDPRVGPAANSGVARAVGLQDSGFFDKVLNLQQMTGVFDASMVSTADFVLETGVDLSKAPSFKRAGECPNFQKLSKMAGVAKTTWESAAPQAAGDDPSGNGPYLAGIYFDNCGRDGSKVACENARVAAPTIVVLENADRWTLVHELMHYSFDQGRKSRRLNPNELVRQVQEGAARLDAIQDQYVQAPNEGDLTSMLIELQSVSPIINQLVTQFGAVEEIGVESYLIQKWAVDELKLVQNEAAVSAFLYIRSSADRAKNSYAPIKSVAASLLNEARNRNFTVASQRALDAANTILGYEAAIDTVVIEAARTVANKLNIPVTQLLNLNQRNALRILGGHFGNRFDRVEAAVGTLIHADSAEAHGHAHGQLDVAAISAELLGMNH